jgi:hypothetical protein
MFYLLFLQIKLIDKNKAVKIALIALFICKLEQREMKAIVTNLDKQWEKNKKENLLYS